MNPSSCGAAVPRDNANWRGLQRPDFHFIVAEVFKSVAKVDILNVPYKGSMLAVSDVVGGQIEMVFSDMVPAVPPIRGGRLRAPAVTICLGNAAGPTIPIMDSAAARVRVD